jgi:tRNA A-37 threonylcarbamoyl transferase component Bud32
MDVPPGAKPQGAEVEAEEPPVLHGNLGGYEIEKLLGKGGMGNVYLARQVSLDRNVALKTLAPKLASDPEFINRFTREAYAAAQLSHHNVVQIHDIGEARLTNFFSMEFVDGQSLADVVRSEGAIDPETAAGYILQAARGLKFAHDHGMVHRDVKPENLLLNDQGVVKVADLGLVKRAGAKDSIASGNATPGAADVRTTQAHVFFGTPFYMAPEQAKDAANVDARADIYSLGCTFYALLTGRPPFTGKTVVEVLSKHAATPITPPEKISPRIAGPLSAIVQKMMAKRVDDRYQNLAQVIQELEEYLGVGAAGPFRPKEEHVKVVSYAAERFANATWARLRPKFIASFYLACGLGAVASAFVFSDSAWRIGMTGGLLGFAILTTLIYQITIGVTQRTIAFRKARQLVWSAGPIEWLKWIAGAGIVCFLLYSFGLLGSWIVFGVLAAGVAIGFHFSVDMLAAKQRKAPVEQAESLVKQMRIKGLEENALRQFVCRYAGDEWEEFYESIFGYEGKLTARRMWGKDDRGHDRKKYAAWRDAFVKWVDHKIERKKQLKEQKFLAKLEAKALAAKGISEKVAAKQAARNAERLVEKASVVREASIQRAAETIAPSKTAASGKSLGQQTVVVVNANFLDDDDDDDASKKPGEGKPGYKRQSAFRRRYGTPVDWVFGQRHVSSSR